MVFAYFLLKYLLKIRLKVTPFHLNEKPKKINSKKNVFTLQKYSTYDAIYLKKKTSEFY